MGRRFYGKSFLGNAADQIQVQIMKAVIAKSAASASLENPCLPRMNPLLKVTTASGNHRLCWDSKYKFNEKVCDNFSENPEIQAWMKANPTGTVAGTWNKDACEAILENYYQTSRDENTMPMPYTASFQTIKDAITTGIPLCASDEGQSCVVYVNEVAHKIPNFWAPNCNYAEKRDEAYQTLCATAMQAPSTPTGEQPFQYATMVGLLNVRVLLKNLGLGKAAMVGVSASWDEGAKLVYQQLEAVKGFFLDKQWEGKGIIRDWASYYKENEDESLFFGRTKSSTSASLSLVKHVVRNKSAQELAELVKTTDRSKETSSFKSVRGKIHKDVAKLSAMLSEMDA